MVTPIAAHTLAVRPLVVPATYRIVIEPMDGWADDLLVSFDGQTGTTLAPGRVAWTCAARTTACVSSGWAATGSSGGCGRSCTGGICRTRSAGSRDMITELRVRDLATIADVTLQLGPGLNVLTGETGAGKSMLVDALALLLGERADQRQRPARAPRSRGRRRLRGRRRGRPRAGSRRSASTSTTAG